MVAKRIALRQDIRALGHRPQHIEAWRGYHTGCSHPRGCEGPAPVLSSRSNGQPLVAVGYPPNRQGSTRMKIVGFSLDGHTPRLGCFVGGDRVMDLAASGAAYLASRGGVRAGAIADALFPQSHRGLLDSGY